MRPRSLISGLFVSNFRYTVFAVHVPALWQTETEAAASAYTLSNTAVHVNSKEAEFMNLQFR
jgi:hypothetical protein